MSLLSALTFILTIVLSIIIVMGLINVLWMSVKERTTEIGTLRAIGMHKRKILGMFLLESLILSVSSTLLGLLATGILTFSLNLVKVPVKSEAFQLFLMTNHLSFSFGFSQAFFIFVSLVSFFTLGSLIPARKAANLNPITAINQY
ncbi:MAG: FtsX-like permease family protein [Bdellovibrionales bacterium]|nr:FtsX-like permease family protein [Bdellovibrionales bacterium]